MRRVNCGLAAFHADGVGLGDVLGDGEELRMGPQGLPV